MKFAKRKFHGLKLWFYLEVLKGHPFLGYTLGNPTLTLFFLGRVHPNGVPKTSSFNESHPRRSREHSLCGIRQ